MKYKSVFAFFAFAGVLYAGMPEVSVSELSQDAATKRVTISYVLTDGDACIVTVDVKTNGPAGYVSIGGENLSTLWGDVNKKIPSGGGSKIIYWNPASSGFEHELSALKVEVSVWSTNNPPDYMVLDLGGQKEHRFYPNVGQIPFGVTNDVYKTDYLVMRKIPAAGITWRMGAGANESPLSSDSTLHLVTLPADFYMAIYEMTQGQMKNLGLSSAVSDWSTFKEYPDSHLRPMEGGSWFNIRNSRLWPTETLQLGEHSYLGEKYLKKKVGDIQFDLPTEAQWEYACRAGTKTKYNNGDNWGLGTVGWYDANCTNEVTQIAETHPVGMKEPNPWGLYDMIGNVREWCLDYYRRDYGISDVNYDNVNFKGPSSCDDGLNNGKNDARVLRGGSYKNNSLDTKSAARSWGPVDKDKSADIGFRVCCPAVYPL